MFFHFHPYRPYINNNTKTLIVGTLPPPRFCEKNFKKSDVDFCYGSKDNLLWPALDKIFNLNLDYNNSINAIKQRKDFLNKHYIGICDIVESCNREKIDASDLGMRNIKLRDIIGYIKNSPNIDKIIFTGKNSKNGPEYFFRKVIKELNLQITPIENDNIRVHKLLLNSRVIKLYSLTSPSNAANRSIGATAMYKKLKLDNPKYTTFDYRVKEYTYAFTN